MKHPALVLSVLLAVPFGVLTMFVPDVSTAAEETISPDENASFENSDEATERPVVLELFTSQGCSSCPPADRLLKVLGERDDVVALSFHVDYWNYIGWTDPFSSEQWSKRQERYARVLEGGRLYTPQLVVDGRAHVVGSDERAVDRMIRQTRDRAPIAEVSLEAHWTDDGVDVVAGTSAATGDLMLAVVESGLETPVSRGENDGRKLRNDHVVRRLERILRADGEPATRKLRVEIDPDWNREELEIVAFLQDPKSLKIGGAAQATIRRSTQSAGR